MIDYCLRPYRSVKKLSHASGDSDRPLSINLMNLYVNLIIARFHGHHPPLVPTSYDSGIKSSASQPSVTSFTSLNRLQRTRRDQKMLRAFRQSSQLIAI